MSDYEFIPCLGYRTKAFKPRSIRIEGVITHSTGAGIISRFKREGKKKRDRTPFDTAVRVYRAIMKSAPHYVVGQDLGQVVQVTPDDYVAQHVSSMPSNKMYQYKPEVWARNPRAVEWLARWRPRDIETPLHLFYGDAWFDSSSGREGTNGQTIGIEVVPRMDDPTGRRYLWTDDCWANLSSLYHLLADRHDLDLSPYVFVAHCDIHPLSRTTASGRLYDTTPLQFSPELFEEKIQKVKAP